MFVYLGVLVGMAEPFGMIRRHTIRDWVAAFLAADVLARDTAERTVAAS